MENRETLIEWVEKNWSIIPEHIRAMRVYAFKISEQETSILRLLKEHTLSWIEAEK